jgi:hypothetical protein
MTEPKVLILDIETSPVEAYVWGLYDQNVGLEQIKSEWSVLAFCAKWLGEKGLIYEDTSGRGEKKVRDDHALLANLWDLLNTADIVVAQNGIKFDIKKINARLIMHGYPPYAPIRVVDTLVAARRIFGFTSNKLAWTSKYLTDAPKSDHRKFPGFELWIECLKDNPAAWAEMKKYNQRDVVATEQLYFRLRPWITNHPNMGTYKALNGGKSSCPKCGSPKLQKRGTAVTQAGQYQRFQCGACAGWSRGKTTLVQVEERKALLV